MIGRILLGALLVTKGNMGATFGAGFFQLAIAQAYLPWVMAGALAVARRERERWSFVLFALAFALLFFCGGIFYTLPALIIVLLVFAFYAVQLRLKPFRFRLNGAITRRFVVAGILTAGMTAFTALTIGLNFWLVGHHPSQTDLPPVDVFNTLYQFVYPKMLFTGLFAEFSYSYVAPLWFLALIFLLIPPLRQFHRSAHPDKDKPLWRIGVVGFLLFLAWGISLSPIFPWLYDHVSLIGQWRFPTRMLGVASFLLIFLIAYRIDGLNRALLTNIRYNAERTGAITKLLVRAAVFLAAFFALNEVYQNYARWGSLDAEDFTAQICVNWMLQYYNNQFVTVQRRDFRTMDVFLRSGVRMSSVGNDYYVNGVPPTIYPRDLTTLPSQLYMVAWDQDPETMREQGFLPIAAAPTISSLSPDYHCVWLNPNALPYTFAVPLAFLQDVPSQLTPHDVSTVVYLGRTPEHIWLKTLASPFEQMVVVAQDVAYPGWTVRVNGVPAQLESVGRLLGVVLPPGEGAQLVEFIYTAPTLKLGGMITLITILGSILYLLRVDQLPFVQSRLPARMRTRVPPRAAAFIALPAQPDDISEPVDQSRFVRLEARPGDQIAPPPGAPPHPIEAAAPRRRIVVVGLVAFAGIAVIVVYWALSRARKR